MSNTTRIYYTKHFTTGLLRGLDVRTSLPFPACTAKVRVAEYQQAAAERTVKFDAITGASFYISNVRAVQE